MAKNNITERVDRVYDPKKDPEAQTDTGQLPQVTIEQKEVTRNGFSGVRITVIAVAVLMVILGILFVKLTPTGVVSDKKSGPFNRALFEEVVKQVRILEISPGEVKQLRLDDMSDPKTLREVKPKETFPRGKGAGNVWAEMTGSGKLKVVIETKDLRQAGEYGFAFSEIPLTLKPFGGGWYTIDVPGSLCLVLPRMKIDEEWWEVLYNLD